MRIAAATSVDVGGPGSRGIAKELNNLNGSGVALQGYDAVAFFTDNKPVRGDQQFQSKYHGATYYFASAEHKAAFEKEPCEVRASIRRLLCLWGKSRENGSDQDRGVANREWSATDAIRPGRERKV